MASAVFASASVFDSLRPQYNSQTVRRVRSHEHLPPQLSHGIYDRQRNPYRNRPGALPRISNNDDSASTNHSNGYYSSESPPTELLNGHEPSMQEDFTMISREYKEDSMPLVQLTSSALEIIRRDLAIQKLSVDTLEAFRVRAMRLHDGLVLPRYIGRRSGEPELAGLKLIKILNHNRAQSIRTDEINHQRGRFGGLFGFNLIYPDLREVVLCAHEFDAMAVYQETNRIALSMSRNQELPDEALPYMEQFSRIVIWFPPSDDAWLKAKAIALKLGQERCYFVRPKEKLAAPMDCLRKDISLRTILGNVDSVEPSLHKAFETFAALRTMVYEDFLHREQKSGVKWQRFPRLTQCLKGHRPGELTVLTGPTGCGKTTFLSEYSIDLCEQGVATLWSSFDMSNVRLARTMMKQYSKCDFDKAIDRFEYCADRFERLPLYFLRFHGMSSIRDVYDAIQHIVYSHDIQHVIVDNTQFIMGMQFDALNKYYDQDKVVEQLRQLATNHGVHVTVVIHPRKEHAKDELTSPMLFSGVKAAQEADNIIILQQVTANQEPFIKRYIQVVKNRYDGELLLGDRNTMEFSRPTMCFSIGKAGAASRANKMQD